MQSALQLDAVLDLLSAGKTVLLPTLSAAGDLRRHYDLRQRALDQDAWEPPKLFSWAQWLESLWDSLTLEGSDDRVLLNSLQEQTLWTALAPAAGLGALPSSTLRPLARQASSGLALAAGFCILDRLSSAADSPDSLAFAAWAQAFEAHCRTGRLLSRALLATTVTDHLRAGRLSTPPSLHLVGFEDLNPSQNALLEAVRNRATAVSLHTLRHRDAPTLLGSCRVPGDPQDELRWAVLWVRQYLAAHPDHSHPVAVILPDPERDRPSLQPLLREWLAPELESVAEDLSSAPWHFGTGPSLASQTMIVHALQLLRWTLDELPTDIIGALLLSPYLAHTDPFESRARFEMHSLRRTVLLRPEMALPVFLKFAAKTRPMEAQLHPAALSLVEWRDLQGQLARIPRSVATHGEWSEVVRRLLHTAGWPGPRALSPTEFRLSEAWDGALDLIATLDLHGARLTFPEFLAVLTAELQSVQVQDLNPDAIVQILRASETEGRLFRAALVLRATDDLWPPPESVHPLLGWALQKNLGMPGTGAERSQQRSLARLGGLAERCSALLLTAADHDAGGPLRLTELAAEASFPPLSAGDLLAPQPLSLPVASEPVFEEAPLPPLPSPRIAGGARVLELQANCGFRALASLRLNATVPEIRHLGGDARESGQDLHKALEIFWQKTQSQAELRALTPAARHAAVSSAVAAALESRRHGQPPGDSWTEAYLDVARQRLTHLIGHWLDNELQRGDFRVMQQEAKQLITVGPLELSIRPDRIDEVEGGLVFVDYKTSQNLSTDHWLGDRPLAPQLPLYALLAEPEEVRGLAFGRVRPGTDMGWVSLQSETGLFPKKGSSVAAGFAGQVAHWQTELARLAEEFAAGLANVDPKSYPKTCEFCQQRLLCRLDPETLLTTADDLAKGPDQDQEDDPVR